MDKSNEPPISTTKVPRGRDHVMTRKANILDFSLKVRDAANAQYAMNTFHNPVDRAVVGSMHVWAICGAQSIIMPHTFAAALMASDARGAMEGQKMPWPSFEIQVPTGLLKSSHAALLSIVVTQMPSTIRTSKAGHQLCVAYLDESSWGVNSYRDLAQMLDDNESKAVLDDENRTLTDYLEEDYDKDVEFRLWKMIARLIAGVVLTINTARIDKPEAYPTQPLRVKRDSLQANTIRLGQPLKIDCRNVIREYIEGDRSSSPSITFLVRGHWRNQAYGPQHSLRRPKWIEPHWKGEGPLSPRPIHIGGA